MYISFCVVCDGLIEVLSQTQEGFEFSLLVNQPGSFPSLGDWKILWVPLATNFDLAFVRKYIRYLWPARLYCRCVICRLHLWVYFRLQFLSKHASCATGQF